MDDFSVKPEKKRRKKTVAGVFKFNDVITETFNGIGVGQTYITLFKLTLFVDILSLHIWAIAICRGLYGIPRALLLAL